MTLTTGLAPLEGLGIVYSESSKYSVTPAVPNGDANSKGVRPGVSPFLPPG
jgi:hypothetical protein